MRVLTDVTVLRIVQLSLYSRQGLKIDKALVGFDSAILFVFSSMCAALLRDV